MSSDPDHCCGNCKHLKAVAWMVKDDGEHRPIAWLCTRGEYYVSMKLNNSCEHYINKFILKVRKEK